MRKLVCAVALLVACSKDKPAQQAVPDQEAASAVEKAPVADSGAAGQSGEKEHRRKHEDRRDPVMANAPPLKLDVVIGGKTQTWQQDSFDKVTKYTKGNDGDARDVWSLHDLATQLVGPKARVTSVTGADGSKPIDAAEWNDASKTPILHNTRRNTLKFRWADASGKWGETVIKEVTKIEITQ